MAAIKKLLSNLFIKSFDFDPNGTSLTDVGWVDARPFRDFAFQFFRTIGTSVVVLKILGNTAINGSGDDVVIKTVTISAQPDAVGDQIFAEVSAEDIAAAGAAAGKSLIGISAQVSVETGTDEAVVTYVFGGARFAKDGLTADIVA